VPDTLQVPAAISYALKNALSVELVVKLGLPPTKALVTVMAVLLIMEATTYNSPPYPT
jgi:hypothetical protein